MNRLTKIVCSIALGAALFTLTACNTTRGFGQDVEKAGDGIKDSADRNGAD